MQVVKLRDAGRWVENLSDELMEAAQRGLLKAAARGLQVLVAEIIPSRSPQPVDRGAYRAGWRITPVDANNVELDNVEPHAAHIEWGVRGQNVKIGRAMLLALSEWAMRKGMATDPKEAIGIAWAIAKNMQKRGIFNRQAGGGLRILEELVNDRLPDILAEEVWREVHRAVDAGVQ